MRFLKRSQTMGVAAVILGGSILLSRIMGLVRDKVISFHYGAAIESDVYFASFVIPDFINYLLAGGYFSITLIPLLAHYFKDDEADGWRFFSAVFTWMAVSITALTLVAWIFAPQLAEVAAPGFDAQASARLALFLRIILPAQIFFLAGSCFTALLYLRRQFAVPALTPLVYNGMIIALGLAFIHKGMEGFCWGVLAGSILGNFLLPLIAVLAGGGMRLGPRFRHKGLGSFVLLALPLMIGQSVVVLDEQLLRVFGSLAREGAVSWLNYARRLMLVPVGVVAQAAGVASYPFLAKLAAEHKHDEFDGSLASALRNTIVFMVPLGAWMMLAAEPAVRLIFEQGRFSVADTAATALCMRIMLAVVFCWGVQQLLGRAFYAHKDTLRPSLTGTAATLACIPLYWVLTLWLDAPGAAAASAFAVALYTGALLLLWRARHGAGGLQGSLRALGMSAGLSFAAAIPAAPCLLLQRLLPRHGLWASLLVLAASGTVFAAAYLALGNRLAPDLMAPILGRVPGLRRWAAGSARPQSGHPTK